MNNLMKHCAPFDDAAIEQPATNLMHHEPDAFWRSSLHTYRLPGVEAACLALQDQCGTDTNLLLYCCGLSTADRALYRHMLRRAMAAVARWQAEVIRPLRPVRRPLKTTPGSAGWMGDRLEETHRDRRTRPRVPRTVRAGQAGARTSYRVWRASANRALPGAYGGAALGGRLATRRDRAGCLLAAPARRPARVRLIRATTRWRSTCDEHMAGQPPG